MQKIVIEKSVAEEIERKLKEINKETCCCDDVEKGMKTVVVPPSANRKGYQYNKMFPDNKKENTFQKKEKRETDEQKLKRYIWENGKRLTDKKFLDLSKNEIKKLINQLRSCHYYDNEGIHVAYGRYEKLEDSTNTKELKGAKILRDLGIEVFLLPDMFAYEKNGSNKKTFGDAIALHKNHIMDFKQVDGENAGSNYATAMAQGHDCLLYITHPAMTLKRVKDQIEWRYIKKFLPRKRLEMKSSVVVHFEGSKKTYLLKYGKKGKLEKEVDLSVYKTSLTKAIANNTLSLNNVARTNSTIPQNKKMSIKNKKDLQKSLGLNDQEFESYLFSIQGNKIHKSFNVEVTDITENNKYKKVEQVEKTLRAIYNNEPFVINHIDTKGDNSEKYQNITLGITDFNKEKIEKAVHSIALALDVEPNVSNKGEPFLYKAQEDFTNNMIKEILKETKKIYLFVIDYFNLPDIRVISKANLRHKGKIVYNPETGKPITKKEWEKFLKEYEKLCQKIYGNFGEKLVMSSEVVGRMLDKITQKYPMEKVKKMSLKEMENLSKMTVAKLTVPKVFYQTFSKEQYFRNRIELAEMSVTNLITTCNENAKNKIKQILIDGIKNKDNKSKIGQQIFERCVGLNTDIQRIVDTEIQNNVNAAIIRSNVENKKENEKIYFKRSEIIDKVTCKKCKAIKGMVVLFSENPLTDEKIKDQYAEYAIWEGKTEGKVPFATMHPYCRGTWYRYYPRVVKK